MRTPGANTLFLIGAVTVSFAAGIGAKAQILTTEFSRLPDGRAELAVTNNSETQTVMAFVILRQSFTPGSSGPTARGLDSYDVLFNPEQHNFSDAIEPLETRRFRYGALSQEIRNEMELKAAVFSDGTTWGDPEWVQRILEWRRHYYTDLGLAVQKIKEALEADTPVEQLRQEFEQLRHSAPRPGEDFARYGEAKDCGQRVWDGLSQSAPAHGNGSGWLQESCNLLARADDLANGDCQGQAIHSRLS